MAAATAPATTTAALAVAVANCNRQVIRWNSSHARNEVQDWLPNVRPLVSQLLGNNEIQKERQTDIDRERKSHLVPYPKGCWLLPVLRVAFLVWFSFAPPRSPALIPHLFSRLPLMLLPTFFLPLLSAFFFLRPCRFVYSEFTDRGPSTAEREKTREGKNCGSMRKFSFDIKKKILKCNNRCVILELPERII